MACVSCAKKKLQKDISKQNFKIDIVKFIEKVKKETKGVDNNGQKKNQ